ncbi:Hint domain-containing protein [uncultured Shimia sp.]|uniref:Hint domain-containing protein n=1 Tax=uncultured Shimia sp. TaxID=573152 RepID=UPI002622AC97|nr:Hint domain-containing protein [uncultured Shimia sp.]
MPDISLTVQNVNGDPASSGGNVNITTGTTVGVVFNEVSALPEITVEPGDTVTIDGIVYTYEFLGSGDVGNDPDQPAAFIRLTGSSESNAPLTEGTTFAIDLTGPIDDPDYPNLPNGNTKLTVSDLEMPGGGSGSGGGVPFPCFTRGTLIATPEGDLPIESLQVGDAVTTMDNSSQIIRWIGRRRLWASKTLAPIIFPAGTLDNTSQLSVSPSHRILVTGWHAELVSGNLEVLVAAKHFQRFEGVHQAKPGIVEYFHILLDRHEIIFANGQAAESLHCHQGSLALVDSESREEILEIFPELRQRSSHTHSTVRPCLRQFEAEAL